MSGIILNLRNEYTKVDHELSVVLAGGARPSHDHPSNIVGRHGFWAGSGPVHPQNVGSNFSPSRNPWNSNTSYPSLPQPRQPITAYPQPMPTARANVSFPPSTQPYQLAATHPPPLQPAQGTMPAPTLGGNTGGSKKPKHTRYCGKYVAVPAIATLRAPRANNQDKSKYRFHCVICNEALRDQRRVFTHFASCVERNGNVNSARWYDHPSIDEANLPDSLLEEVWN